MKFSETADVEAQSFESFGVTPKSPLARHLPRHDPTVTEKPTMSAISFPTQVDLEVPVRSRMAVMPPSITYPYPPAIADVRKRSSQARAANMFASVLLNGMLIVLFASIAFVASGFVGNVQLEAANREAMQSADRAAAANVAESGLRREVDALGSDDAITRWSTYNKFKAPYNVTRSPKTPVAK